MGVFQEWWKGLQPPSRDMSGDWPPPRVIPDGADWSGLMRNGPNGFYLVVVALSWWVSHATTQALREEFDSIVDDVNWVLMILLGLMSGSGKRSRDLVDDEENDQPRKKYVLGSTVEDCLTFCLGLPCLEFPNLYLPLHL